MSGQTRRHLFAAAALTGAWVASKATRAFAGDYDGVRSHPHEWDHDHKKKPLHCFLRGTLIATPSGDRPIETLVAGDEVATWQGPNQPIKWVGSYKWDRPHFDKELMPIRILASGLAPTIPRRDLWISQHHAVVVGGMLIEAGCLLTFRTITRHAPPDDLEYFHIKLDQHSIILAEGAPCETLRGLNEPACMPLTEYEYTRGAVKSHLRSALAPLVDVRTPADVARDRIWTAHYPA